VTGWPPVSRFRAARITSSGVTAAIINLALERIGHEHHSLYDGSWAEWGMYDDLKIETGR